MGIFTQGSNVISSKYYIHFIYDVTEHAARQKVWQNVLFLQLAYRKLFDNSAKSFESLVNSVGPVN